MHMTKNGTQSLERNCSLTAHSKKGFVLQGFAFFTAARAQVHL